MKGTRSVSLALLLLVAAGVGLARERRGPVPGTPSYPTPAFDRSGALWLAYNDGPHLYVTHSTDLGESFAPAVRVNPEPEPIDANGEGRPKIAFTAKGTLVVTWTRKLDQPYTGEIRFSRSEDGGRSFSPPVTVNDDGLAIGHRFDALAVAPSGEIVVAWIDKRDLTKAMAEHQPYAGAALYLAVSEDDGRTFGKNRKLVDNVCECCRLAFGFDAVGRASLLFRDVLPSGIRDHAIVEDVLERGPVPPRSHRVTFDDWKIDACPHHGPSFAIDAADTYHVAWFTAGDRTGTGVFYARSTDGGVTFSGEARLGTEQATHPFVLSEGGNVYLVWMEARGSASAVRSQTSSDHGATWSSARTLAKAAPGADHPLLVKRGSAVYLSWFSKESGYRLVSVSGEGK